MADVDGLRIHANIPDEEDDDLLEHFLQVGIRYAENAGVAEPTQADALYDDLVYRIAGYYYDNRAMPDRQPSDAEFMGINSIILMLRNG